ncbi:MAG TPA: DUF475 domain-containing protein [Candidatus Saccharimonadia bacterium]|nr:DUF475 domain-containing protein [Candidatus Saccharimonadia bacterium]
MNVFGSLLSAVKYPLLVLLAGVVLAAMVGGPGEAVLVAVLAVLEISLSFDNAVINATVLRRLNAFWQRMFMTVGMVIAVVGMRLVFPVVIVAVTAGLGFGAVIDLILNHPSEYAVRLADAHPAIAAFGGIFLLMIFLDFLLDEAKRVHWLAVIEAPLASGGRLKTLSSLLALLALIVVSHTWGAAESQRVMMAGVTGLATYLAVRGFSELFEQFGGVRPDGSSAHAAKATVGLAGRAALFLFLYLEVLDASFSFDGVIGAFAITSNVLTIAIGLGVGAFFVRELTVWLVRHDTLGEFIYLEHGAHYALGALAVLMAASLRYDVPEVITGLTGAIFIGLAVMSSLQARGRRHA